jgi:hypothetical protein
VSVPRGAGGTVRCFLLFPTETVRLWLRRYTSVVGGWTCAEGHHEAMTFLQDAPAVFEPSGADDARRVLTHAVEKPGSEDPRWPAGCGKCAYAFTDADVRQLFYDLLYRRMDTGEILTLREAPPGAMWSAWWLSELISGPDGNSLMVKCPNGREWFIDGQASNCPMKDDYQQRRHHCWIRHGTPPDITVDKDGVTCSAGGGSILAGDYHGFLRGGVFT